MGVTKDFSVGTWYKSGGGAGSLITLKTTAGAVYFDLRTTATGYTMTINGQSATLTCTPSTNWQYIVATVTVQTATASNVCIRVTNCESCGTVNAHYVEPTALRICTGENGFTGTIRSLHFYNLPFTQTEAALTY